MYDFSFFVDVSFRIINLAVLIFLIRYVFKNYLLEAIKKKIEERRQQIRSLEEHLIAVSHQRDQLAAIINQESGLSLQMEKKISRWADAVAHEIKMRNTQKEQIMRKLQGQAQAKQEALMRKQAQLEVIPQSLNAARVILQKEFADPKRGALVVADVMNALRAKK